MKAKQNVADKKEIKARAAKLVEEYAKLSAQGKKLFEAPTAFVKKAALYAAKRPEIYEFLMENEEDVLERVQDFDEYGCKMTSIRMDNSMSKCYGGYAFGAFRSISNRAMYARLNGFLPASAAAKKTGVNVEFIYDALEPSSWHHSGNGKYGYKKIYHYDTKTIEAFMATPYGQMVYQNYME